MRSALRTIASLVLSAMLFCLTQPLHAQNAALEQSLKAQFTLTKMTADKSDIITAGSVLDLHKDGLQMCSTDAVSPITSTYKNGKLSAGFGSMMLWGASLGAAGQNTTDIAQRKFVAGEKFWITSYTVQSDAVLLMFYSDPINDVRYYGQLKIPFPKGAVPPADEVMRTINEVVTAEPMDNAAQPAPAPDSAPPPSQALAPIAPPPPPADQPPAPPKTVAIGQTRDQVVAIFGQPQKVAKLPTKEIDYYPDMKVIFVHGKVADVQ
ncbi:MAG: hypothetical protein WA532_04100 [Candidatus Korobacteraceae bacterium]